MAIASRKPNTDKKPLATQAEAIPDNYKTAVVEDNEVPILSLISYVEGAPYVVDYFSQVLGLHDDLRSHDPGQLATNQTYTRIKDFEIRTLSDLDTSPNSDEGTVSVMATAFLYPSTVPNVGDMFIAEIGGNTKALFTVTTTERSTYRRDSGYKIEYAMVTFIDNTDESKNRIEDLEAKVTSTYYFHRDRLVMGLNPKVIDSEHHNLLSIKDEIVRMTHYFFKTFWSREHSTLIIPGQSKVIYDPFLLDYILKIVDPIDAPEIRQTKNLGTANEIFTEQPQFWTAMLERDNRILSECNREMGIVSVKTFADDPVFHGIRYTGIHYVVYPISGDDSIISGRLIEEKPISFNELDQSKTGRVRISDLFNNQVIEDNPVQKLYPFVHDDDKAYIFSSNFYNEGVNLTALEGLVLNYLRLEPINRSELMKLINQINTRSRLDQFYYLPILITLAKAARGV